MTTTQPLTPYGTTGLAKMSRTFARGPRLKTAREAMTAPERVLVSSPHTDGTGLLERPLAVLAHGRQSFTQADGTTREFDGFQVALVTTDQPDMDNHGPTTFFIPQSCITFDPAHMPSVASTPSSGRQTPTTSAPSAQQVPAPTTPSSQQADNCTVVIESPPGRAPLHGLHYATAPECSHDSKFFESCEHHTCTIIISPQPG